MIWSTSNNGPSGGTRGAQDKNSPSKLRFNIYIFLVNKFLIPNLPKRNKSSNSCTTYFALWCLVDLLLGPPHLWNYMSLVSNQGPPHLLLDMPQYGHSLGHSLYSTASTSLLQSQQPCQPEPQQEVLWASTPSNFQSRGRSAPWSSSLAWALGPAQAYSWSSRASSIVR